jgi:heat-inducible transcriptional repressor
VPRPLTSRQREILTAVVESYIATGEPVSSGTLAQSAFANSISSATLRNEMADLAEAGLLDQPHTSAGRVPSAEAFRLYVSEIQTRQSRPVTQPSESQTALLSHIDTSFAGIAGTPALLERTSHVLAALSSGVGVAIGASASADLLEHIHFSRLAANRILAVVVTHGGVVRDRVLSLDHDLSLAQLETAANFLNEHFRGWNIERVRAELTRRVEQERSAYRQMSDAIHLWSQTVPGSAAVEHTVYVDGLANLAAFPEDRSRLRELLAALEQKQQLVDLLTAYIDARQGSVRVVFDLEQQSPNLAGLVLIAAPTHVSEDTLGAVAILGPKRMHYESAMNAVGYIAQVLNQLSPQPDPGRTLVP